MHLYSPLICLVLLLAAGNCCFVHGLQHQSHGYRRQMNQMRTMAQWAYQHGMRINEEAMCAKPRAELVYLTDNNKIYLPRATLLHRCSDLTGCCPHATHSCQPTQVETVSLYFFTISVQSLSRLRQNQNIEKINFLNHTECACLLRPEVPIDNGRSESLRKNESFFSADGLQPKMSTAMSEQAIAETNDNSSSDDARAATTYNDDLPDEQGEDNQIDVHNGMSESGDAQGNVLKYWSKLLGLYKTKVYRDHEPPNDSLSSANLNGAHSRQSTAVRRIDSAFARTPLPSPRPLSAVHFVPYQSQYMYLYPPVSSQYRAPVETANYHLAYRRVH